jgi:tripartite-type tricarboxylate transporter receptor subunit TctC
MKRRDTLKALLGGLAGLALARPALPQPAWPSKTIRIIAPVQPGGGVDLVARTVAERLQRVLGQTVIVENISGGGGITGSLATARAPADGYTLMIGYVGTHGTNPAVRKLPYDAIADFTPIAMVGGTPNVLVVQPGDPAKSVAEFIRFARANPGKLSYGSSGQGTLTHLVMEQLKEATGTFMVHVPYRGIGPAMTDFMGGQTQVMAPGLAAALPFIKSGRMKALAVTGLQRHRLLPNVPTLEESGFKGFDGVQWYGVVAPANLPSPIVRRLNDEINLAIVSPELREKLSSEALEPMPMSPEQFGQYIRNDIAKWVRLVKARKIEIE